MKDVVTIIVPIYKVEQYLDKCIDSIVGQTYKELEIILIDDGSPDRCGKICDVWEKRDNRIKVIHKENGGLSDARNAGLDIAAGEYIACIDSDDYIEKTYIEYLYTLIKEYNADIACCGLNLVSEDGILRSGGKFKTANPIIFNRIDALKEMLYGKHYSNSAWGKLYKTELFHNVRYPKGKLFEDMFTTYKLFDKCEKAVYGPNRLYNYLQRTSSITGSVNPFHRLDVIQAEEELLVYAKDHVPEILPAARYKLFASSIVCLNAFSPYSNNADEKREIERLWNNIRELRLFAIFNSHVPMNFRLLGMAALLGRDVLKWIYDKFI